MASVAFHNGHDRTQGPQLLDLDSGPEPPQWLQVIGGTLLIIAFAALLCLWLKPLIHPDQVSQVHPSPNAVTVPAIRTLIPDHRIAPESTTIGPIASGATYLESGDPGSRTMALSINSDM